MAGLALAPVTSWWLILLGAAAVAAAWFYTGGDRPYGYRALGEVSVFLFFGLAAVTGTAYVQMDRVAWLALAAAVPIGLLACALLVINNLRDIPTDSRRASARWPWSLGDHRTRLLYAACALLPFASRPRWRRSGRWHCSPWPPCRRADAGPAGPARCRGPAADHCARPDRAAAAGVRRATDRRPGDQALTSRAGAHGGRDATASASHRYLWLRPASCRPGLE